MNALQTRHTELQAAGRLPLYGYGLAIVDSPSKADGVLLQLGLQPSGRYLYMPDLDSHTAGQNADAAKAAFERAEPEIARKLPWFRSRGGKGWHVLFESYKRLATGKLYADGEHIGELLGDGRHTADPGDLEIPILSPSEIERLCAFWLVQGGDASGARWSDRAKQGERWTAGYTRIHVTQAELRTFLRNECGRVGQHFDRLLDERGLDRSNAAGNLMQTLMLFAHKLPGLRDAPYTVKCSTVMAYWMAAESFGKAGEKDYSQEKDGYSLIAQIVNGDRLDNGKAWTCPFWAKSQTPIVTEKTEIIRTPPAAAPAHRPSDQPRRLGRLRKVLQAIEADDWGRRVYFLDDLATRLKTPRRTLQADLRALRDAGEITTAQIGGNAAPYAILMPCFGGARSTLKPDKSPLFQSSFGGASDVPSEGAVTPQTGNRQPVCNKEEDHQKSSAPAGQPPAAAGRPVGAQGFGDPPLAPAGALPASVARFLEVEAMVKRDAAALAEYWKDMPGFVPQPDLWMPLTPPRPPIGKFTFGSLGWRASVRTPQRRKVGGVKQARFTGRDQQVLSSKYANKKRHGQMPTPVAYRSPARLPEESLPADLGAPAELHAYDAVGLVERLRRLNL